MPDASDTDASPSPSSEASTDASDTDASERTSAASTVAAGILASRLVGLLRERTIAYFFGVSAHADVWQFVSKAPNLLQNLLGEGTISAAFIPIYSRMIDEGREEAAGRFAGAIFGLLLAVAGGLALIGILLAEPIVTVLAPGFTDDAARVAAGELTLNRFDLAVQTIRIMFPMAGLLVLAAWALGVLNSHRRFLIPYIAPVAWNVAIIGGLAGTALVWLGNPFDLAPGDLPTETLNTLLFATCVGALAGGALQFIVQLPSVTRVLSHFRISLSTRVEGVRESVRAFGPAVAGRGVAQISGYIDLFLASFLAVGALSALRYGLMLYMLPVSLFGMSVAASELPELSRITGDKVKAFLQRLKASLRQILFLTVPTAVGYLAFGFLIVGALLRTGTFDEGSNWLVYLVLGGYTLGLLATTMSRLLQNAFYALQDTKTPAKIAVLRVAVSTAIAIPLMFWLDAFALTDAIPTVEGGETLYLGALGLALGSSVGAWVELGTLRWALDRQMETFRFPVKGTLQMTALAVVAAVPAAGVWWLLPAWHVILEALIVVSIYAGCYLGMAYGLGFEEMERWAGRLADRLRG